MDKVVVRHALNWTEENLFSGAGVEELVTEVGYSRKTLEIWFRRTCDFSPGEYLMRRRMSRAAVLLRMTTLSVIEIADLFHFHSPQNFARAFKKLTGFTPTEYRKGDNWLFAVLQPPLLEVTSQDIHTEWCTLPEMKMYGPVIHCQDNFISLMAKKIIIEAYKKTISESGISEDREVCIAARFILSTCLNTGRDGTINVEIISQRNADNTTEECTGVIPGGKYLKSQFKGSWEEYMVFTRQIYHQVANEKAMTRRDGYDLTFFTSPDDCEDEVNCQYYIPVNKPGAEK